MIIFSGWKTSTARAETHTVSKPDCARRTAPQKSAVLANLFGLICGVGLFLVPPAAQAASDPVVAKLGIYSDDSAFGENASGFISGHAFIGVTNTSTNNITVGKLGGVGPGETVTVGTWGKRAEHVGLWYNLEAYLIHNDSAAFATVSASYSMKASQLRVLNSYIASHDSHGGTGVGAAANNCSTFASGAWNAVVPWDSEVFAGWPAQTPTVLAESIYNLPHEVGTAGNIAWGLHGVFYADGKRKPVESKIYVVPDELLTFDDLPTGTPVTDQYSDFGVVFSGTPGPRIMDDGANPTSPVLSPGDGYSGSITIQFQQSVSSVAFDVGYMDAEAGATVSWYSKSGRLLGSRTSSGYGMVKMLITDTSTYRIVIDTTADPAGAAIDNLAFTHA